MSLPDKGRPLPKFGEWDVNNPASAEGFTVIFNKARDEKKTNGTVAGSAPATQRNNRTTPKQQENQHPSQKKWLCCFSSQSA